METPAIPAPRDANEIKILANLESTRDQLLLLKQDRTKYIRSQDVIRLYDEVIEQVRLLNQARDGTKVYENRLDRVLDSCFQLLSLFFMTIGRTNEAPAAYALTSTIKRLLDHLTEAKVFSAKDLDSLTHTLSKISHTVKNADDCSPFLAMVQKLGPPLPAIHEKLVTILRTMAHANTKARFSASEVKKLQTQLKEIGDKRVDEKFQNEKGEVPAGNDEVVELLDKCRAWSELLLQRKGVIPDNFKPMYGTLVGIRNDLEKLSVTQAWSLRETDLFDFQRQLDKFDEARIDGNWVDDDGNPAELYVQRVKHSGGVSSPRELYPYSMKLNSIDNMRVDGKFMVADDIPEGQGNVTELLSECFDLNYELRLIAEEKAEGGSEGDDKESTSA
ncbi:hypothetical protein CMQ_5944 [Grosmannia clavigera kw1407]|uniref:Uncharacterized protein n=1 Tax=Grosmannia clavigera (strain kw1407 / UAMH 11150) TaxID=655863 RepID=F0XM61_GROCL|nr:uncharacterized protein CMQ_5944 [Grosmannia clavigera kw1407]EFX01002.1 hypothetical protein CMQ_5944 [Grosmannia clavigera kw1407]